MRRITHKLARGSLSITNANAELYTKSTVLLFVHHSVTPNLVRRHAREHGFIAIRRRIE